LRTSGGSGSVQHRQSTDHTGDAEGDEWPVVLGGAVIDPEAVQRSFQVLVWVDLLQGTRDVIEAFERALLDIPDVIEAQRLFGEPDYLLRVWVRDSDEYERIYTNRLAALPGISKARSQIGMKTIKQGLTLPIT
jgi:Lrp/AsnC family transcriptional regulator, leucine-responsive regulatory protein